MRRFCARFPALVFTSDRIAWVFAFVKRMGFFAFVNAWVVGLPKNAWVFGFWWRTIVTVCVRIVMVTFGGLQSQCFAKLSSPLHLSEQKP